MKRSPCVSKGNWGEAAVRVHPSQGREASFRTEASLSVFVDTGVLFGAAVAGDSKHRQAAKLLSRIAREAPFTTDHVIVEAFAMIRSRRGWGGAMGFVEALRETSLRVEGVTTEDLERARSILRHWDDLELDLVDGTSIAVMERVGCRRVATFDSDFAIYRFGKQRREAFEIWN